MAELSASMPTVTVRLKLTRSPAYSLRMRLLMAALWVANKVAPREVEIETETFVKDA
jgi:hypothetical protein